MHHPHRLFYTTSILFILLFLSACATAPLKDAQDTTSGSSCRAVASWLASFTRNYPALSLASLPPQAANLFRDSAFTPVFGFPYNAAHADKISTRHEDLINPCLARDSATPDKELLASYEDFFRQTFKHFNPAMAMLADDYTQRAAWMRQALNELPGLSADTAGLARLETEFVNPGRILMAPLWPEEQKLFNEAISGKRAELIARITPGAGVPLPQGTPPPPAPDPAQQTLAARIAQKRQALAAIPLDLDGRAQSAAWIAEFDREFSVYEGSREVTDARWAWLARRQEIFRATRRDFMARLDSLPAGPGTEAAHAQLLTDTFPLPSDRTMPVYAEYRAAMTARQRPFFQRSFEKALDAMVSLRNRISDAARKTVHGDRKP